MRGGELSDGAKGESWQEGPLPRGRLASDALFSTLREKLGLKRIKGLKKEGYLKESFKYMEIWRFSVPYPLSSCPLSPIFSQPLLL